MNKKENDKKIKISGDSHKKLYKRIVYLEDKFKEEKDYLDLKVHRLDLKPKEKDKIKDNDQSKGGR